MALLDEADDPARIAFAFTVPDLFKPALRRNSSDGPLCLAIALAGSANAFGTAEVGAAVPGDNAPPRAG